MLIIGHRGARGLAPENTMAGLEAALDAHVAMIEMDVRVSKDGIAVLMHDEFIKDKEDKKLFIAQTDFGELQAAKPDLLTLEAALHFIDRRTDVIIEIKPGVNVEPVAAAIEPRINASWLESDIIISSFDFHILKQLHEKFPNIQVAVNERWSGMRASRRAKALGTLRIMMNQRWLWIGFIHAAHKSGYKLSAYTINNPKKARRWAKAGLYGCVTDEPQKFLDNYAIKE